MTAPAELLPYVAYALSCRPAWIAARHGDRDPQVLAQAEVYRDWIGGDL